MIELALETKVVVKLRVGDWQVLSLSEISAALLIEPTLDQEFKVITWSSVGAAKIASAYILPATVAEALIEVPVVKLYAGGLRLRCAPACTWQVTRRHEGLITVTASSLKSGDALSAHGRLGKDALHKLPGYAMHSSISLAQTKTANEKRALSQVEVYGGSNLLLENGLFCGGMLVN